MMGVRLLIALSLVVCSAASISAQGKSVDQLKKAGDVRGLVAMLGDHRATVRRDAAVALPGVVDKVKDRGSLAPLIGPLIESRLRDPWASTREYSGRALMAVLNSTTDQPALRNAVQPLADALNHGQTELDRRQYAAVALSAVVMRLERVDLLQPRMPDLVSATFKDPDAGVRKYAERALQHTLQKLDDEPTLTLAANSLAAQLDSKDEHFRSYSAVMLSGVVRKIKDPVTLKSLLGRITTAATKDPDKGVREYAGRAMQHIQHVLNEEQKPDAPKADSAPKGSKPASDERATSGRTDESRKSGNQRVVAAARRTRTWPVKSIEELTKAVDFHGLVARLSDPRGGERQAAAWAMREVVKKVKDPATLDSTIGRLLEVRFHEPWKSTRENSGLALQYLLTRTSNQAVLRNALRAIFDALPHGQIETGRRRYAATILQIVVLKLDNPGDLLRPRVPALLTSTFNDPDEHVRHYTGAALSHALHTIDDETTIRTIAHHLVADRQLQSEDLRARRFSAQQLYRVVPKVKDHPNLRALLGRITAATKDKDERVRQDADRAMRRIHVALNN